jgi:hypothetical protein
MNDFNRVYNKGFGKGPVSFFFNPKEVVCAECQKPIGNKIFMNLQCGHIFCNVCATYNCPLEDDDWESDSEKDPLNNEGWFCPVGLCKEKRGFIQLFFSPSKQQAKNKHRIQNCSNNWRSKRIRHWRKSTHKLASQYNRKIQEKASMEELRIIWTKKRNFLTKLLDIRDRIGNNGFFLIILLFVIGLIC